MPENASTVEQEGTPVVTTDSAVVPETTTEDKKVEPAPVLEPKKLSLQDVPTEELLKDERVQRLIQSMKDREIAVSERRRKEEEEQRQTELRRRREEEEFQKLEADEDYETIGRKTLEQRKEEKLLEQAAARVSGAIEKKLRENPEFANLGDEVIQRTFNRVKEQGGTIVDWMTELHKTNRDVYLAREKATFADEVKKTAQKEIADLRSKMETELEAIRAEAGLTKRQTDAETGNAPAPAVSRSSPSPGSAALTPEQAEDLYGQGAMSYAEYLPYRQAKLRNK